jgi:hypothetical protein
VSLFGRGKGTQFNIVGSKHVAYRNDATLGARQATSLRIPERIPEGWGATGHTNQFNSKGDQIGTLLHVKPEVQNQTLASRASDLHEGWTPDTPPADVGPVKIFEQDNNPRRALR